MSIASATESCKVDSRDRAEVGGESLAELMGGISAFVQQAGANGTTLREFERNLLDHLRQIGHAATEQCLTLPGNGDLGETTVDDDGRDGSLSEGRGSVNSPFGR